jgi:ABC-2 type transport system permease protein
LALAITTACTTRRQAHSVATVVVLILSALGGSMVPRFLMPPLMQDIGWLTPNTWALEAYLALFWREEPLAALLLPLVVLFGAAALGLVAAQLFARRLQSL